MGQVTAWLHANQSWLIPLVLYIALNVCKRSYLVENPNPLVRGFAGALEKILLLEWDRWGGNFKFLVSDEPE